MSTPTGASHPDRPAIDLVVMLAGGLKPSPLAAAAGRSVLDLSVDGRQTILDHWLEHLAPLATSSQGLPVRILHGSSLTPTAPDHLPGGLEVSIERELKEYRGPAGVVKDAAEHLPQGATVLVVEAARWFGGDLGEVVRAHHAHDGEPPEPSSVTVVAGQGRAPAGIVVLERSTLDSISQLGFMDLKEQWLGRVAESGRSVRVVDLGGTPSVLLREREGMLTAARHATKRHFKANSADQNDSRPIRSLYSGSDQGYFAALSPQATIEPNTSIVDSVIMEGAVVKAGAIVARSVICPGAVVAEAEVVVDQVRSGPAHASAPSAAGLGTRPTGRGEYSG
ncbi:MAG: hypothetical protein ACIAQF_10400 [Phycisphaerales bacterium JB065]